jgi:hypothetical protein
VALPAGGKLLQGVEAEISFAYDLRTIKSVYGMISDKVYLSIDGRRCEQPITTAAIVVDNFSGQDRAGAAECEIAPAFHNFGRVKAGQALSKEITISNAGKSPLIIRAVSTRKGSATSLKAGTVIEAGKSLQFTVSLSAEGGTGVKTGGITIIVNEPNYPMREVRVAAEIEK